jgi:YD repeat-containing protein
MNKNWKMAIMMIAFSCASICMADRFEYDDLNRLTKVTYDNGCTITYEYDEAGNLLKRTSTGPDTSKPVLIHPDSLVIALKQGETSTKVDFPVSASDAIDSVVQVICTPSSGSVLNVGRTWVYCQAISVRKTFASDSFKVIVKPYRSGATDTTAKRAAAAITLSTNKTIANAEISSVKLAKTGSPEAESVAASSRQASATLITIEKPSAEAKPLVPETIAKCCGLFTPPDDGLYIFTMIGTLGSQLWMSPNEEPAGKMPMLQSDRIKITSEDTLFLGIKCFKNIRLYFELRTPKNGAAQVFVKGPGIINKNLQELLKNKE